jgi:HK97 gp10 family phage protein
MAARGVVFELQGLQGFRAALERATDDVRKQVSQAMEDTAEAVRARAQSSVEDGDLRHAIITSGKHGGLTWRVGISDDVFPSRGGDRVHQRPFIYGAILEHGSRKQAARPFMRPAADVELPRFQSRIQLTGLIG